MFKQHARHHGRHRQHVFSGKGTTLPKPEASQRRIRSIDAASVLFDIGDVSTTIENVQYVASFSWEDTSAPSMLVPGTPPRWHPPPVAQSLPEDSSVYYRDPNSARFPSFPIEPTVRAIREVRPGFDFTAVDVVGCGNTLGSLLSFVRDEERTFRFGVELIGSTLFLVRKTNTLREVIDNVYGYGHTFPETYTQWDNSVKRSASHQRIISYDFAGLRFLVRAEADGYLPGLSNDSGCPLESAADMHSVKEQICSDETEQDDSHRLLSLALGLQTPLQDSKLSIRSAGKVVPQRAIFDLKTRATYKQDLSLQEFLPRLWINQIPNMVLAYHERGRFSPNNIHVVSAVEKVAQWEKENAALRSRLGALLHTLVGIWETDGRARFEVRRIGNGFLEIWSEVPTWSALPLDLKRSMGMADLEEHRGHNEKAETGEKHDGLQAEDEDEGEGDDSDSDLEYLKF